MSSRRSDKRSTKNIRHAGRVTLGDCPVRGGGEECAPLNRVTIYTAKGTVKDHCTCSCGRQFKVSHPDAAEHLVPPLPPQPGDEPAPGISETWRIDEVYPIAGEARHAVVGVVPIGTEVLHVPTHPVGRITDDVKALGKHLVKVMHQAPGVGLAANQAGAPLRMFVQVHRRAAPEVWVDPEIRATAGTWRYPEGCLSVEVPHSQAVVVRPKRIQVRGRTVHGDVVEATLDEVVARIAQHEIDHLDGIEYVQRLTGDDAERIYATLEADEVDTSWVPARPY